MIIIGTGIASWFTETIGIPSPVFLDGPHTHLLPRGHPRTARLWKGMRQWIDGWMNVFGGCIRNFHQTLTSVPTRRNPCLPPTKSRRCLYPARLSPFLDPCLDCRIGHDDWLCLVCRNTIFQELDVKNQEQCESVKILLRKMRMEDSEDTLEGRQLKGPKRDWGGVVENWIVLSNLDRTLDSLDG
ncbi:hypothetical protein BLNAU_14934 [Blattamonas nauphoetae]|uniref:Uncharacterized protein n=1 Tax=Blattamonas nauphoetae TaxID=2049346 RepID=A0ABQ9XFL9_9EUKA|nr:hypothetical protein BLNAU_14934 [Blattamonas nauphoetae]